MSRHNRPAALTGQVSTASTAALLAQQPVTGTCCCSWCTSPGMRSSLSVSSTMGRPNSSPFCSRQQQQQAPVKLLRNSCCTVLFQAACSGCPDGASSSGSVADTGCRSGTTLLDPLLSTKLTVSLMLATTLSYSAWFMKPSRGENALDRVKGDTQTQQVGVVGCTTGSCCGASVMFTHPTHSSSTSQAFLSLHSSVLVQESITAWRCASGTIRFTSLPPWGACSPSTRLVGLLVVAAASTATALGVMEGGVWVCAGSEADTVEAGESYSTSEAVAEQHPPCQPKMPIAVPLNSLHQNADAHLLRTTRCMVRVENAWGAVVLAAVDCCTPRGTAMPRTLVARTTEDPCCCFTAARAPCWLMRIVLAIGC